jgi:hypothetical protein
MKPPCKPRATPVQTARSGNLTKAEITSLVLHAREAFDYQKSCQNIPPEMSFDDWRRQQVFEAVGKGGISQIVRSEWRTVAAHFLTAASRLDEAFEMLNRTGQKSYRPNGPGDTWETAESLVAKILEALSIHAATPLADGTQHIHAGWLIAAARQRTGKPTLTLETLAERLSPEILVGLLSHMRNHIAKREGRSTDRRAKRVYPPKADPDDFEPSASDPF